MIILKYDLITALQCGYTGKPDQVMKDQGYSWFSVIYTKDVYFYEVETILHPLPPFLEASDVVDGRFDPRITEKRVIPAPINIVDNTVSFNQDPTVMTAEFEPMGYISSIAEEEKEREDYQETKAKKASTTKK